MVLLILGIVLACFFGVTKMASGWFTVKIQVGGTLNSAVTGIT